MVEIAISSNFFDSSQQSLPEELSIADILRSLSFDSQEQEDQKLYLFFVHLNLRAIGKRTLIEGFMLFAETLFLHELIVSAITESTHARVNCEVVSFVEILNEAILAVD